MYSLPQSYNQTSKCKRCISSNAYEDESMPLIIRKGSSRGQEFTHPSGRKVIISDNTFALWVYRNVLDGKTYSLLELKNKLNSNEIPMVYALTKEDKEKAKYTKTLGKE